MTRDYDPKRVIVSFRGAQIVGFMADTFATVERATDTFSTVAGADGEPTRVRSHDKTGTATLTLQAESPSNDHLSASHAADELSTGGGVGPFSIEDLNGRTLLSAPQAWVQRVANVEYSNEASGREWTIGLGKLQMTVGGA